MIQGGGGGGGEGLCFCHLTPQDICILIGWPRNCFDIFAPKNTSSLDPPSYMPGRHLCAVHCVDIRYDSSGPPIAPICALLREIQEQKRQTRRYYSACSHYWLFPSVPSDFTGTKADNRHYSTGSIDGLLLYCTMYCAFSCIRLHLLRSIHTEPSYPPRIAVRVVVAVSIAEARRGVRGLYTLEMHSRH